MIKKNWKILLIILFGVVLRFYLLGDVPSSLNRDEAALSYNAYSLIETGKDEFGESWPLAFKSFGDYKMPGYIYLIIPFVKVFGLNNLSVRMLSALAGSLTILVIYLLGLQFFKSKKVALLSALGLAISPWSVFYSRVGFETNVAVFFISLAFLLLFKGLKKPWLWLVSAFFMILALFTYNHSFIVIPIMLLVFLGLYFKKVFTKKRVLWALVSTLMLVSGGLVTYRTFSKVNEAKGMIAVYNNPILHQEWSDRRTEHELKAQGNKPLSFAYKLVDNQYSYFGGMILSNMLKNFSPSFLTVRESGFVWNGVSGIGFFYYVDVAFILIGLGVLLKKIKSKESIFLVILLLAGTIPAALSIDQAHPNRSLNMFLGLYLVIGLGVNYVLERNKGKVLKLLVIVAYSISVLFMIQRYFIYHPKNYLVEWFDKVDEAIHTVNDLNPNEIILSQDLSEIYIYYLFYSKFPPQLFQDSVVRTKGTNDFYTVHEFGNVRVLPLEYFDKLKINPKSVVLGTGKDTHLIQNGDGGGVIEGVKREFVYRTFSLE